MPSSEASTSGRLKSKPIFANHFLDRNSLPTPPTPFNHRRRSVIQFKKSVEEVGSERRCESSACEPALTTEQLPQTFSTMAAPSSPPRSPRETFPTYAAFVNMMPSHNMTTPGNKPGADKVASNAPAKRKALKRRSRNNLSTPKIVRAIRPGASSENVTVTERGERHGSCSVAISAQGQDQRQQFQDERMARTLNKKCPLLLARWLSQGHVHESNEIQKKFDDYTRCYTFVPSGGSKRAAAAGAGEGGIDSEMQKSLQGQTASPPVKFNIEKMTLRLDDIRHSEAVRRLEQFKMTDLSAIIPSSEKAWAFSFPCLASQAADREVFGTLVDLGDGKAVHFRIWNDCGESQTEGFSTGYIDFVMTEDEPVLWVCVDRVSRRFFETVLFLVVPNCVLRSYTGWTRMPKSVVDARIASEMCEPSDSSSKPSARNGPEVLLLQLTVKSEVRIDLKRSKTMLRLLFSDVRHLRLEVLLSEKGDEARDFRFRTFLLDWCHEMGAKGQDEVLLIQCYPALMVLRDNGTVWSWLIPCSDPLHQQASTLEAFQWLQERLRDIHNVTSKCVRGELREPLSQLETRTLKAVKAKPGVGQKRKIGAVTVSFKKCKFKRPHKGIERCMVFGDLLILNSDVLPCKQTGESCLVEGDSDSPVCESPDIPMHQASASVRV